MVGAGRCDSPGDQTEDAWTRTREDAGLMTEASFPVVRSVVLDAADARGLAEFYRQLLGYEYRAGDEPPLEGVDDPNSRDWLVLCHPSGSPHLAFQQVDHLVRSTWPEGTVPQQLHLDLSVPDGAALAAQHERALRLGARLLLDRFDDPVEQLYVYADPEGHPFCIFVA
jgi:catechol 2,3-dioxygenase-like lactoylglutathione lyase family enzyme